MTNSMTTEVNINRKRKVDAHASKTLQSSMEHSDGSVGTITIEKVRFEQLVSDNARLTNDVATLSKEVQVLKNKLGIKQESAIRSVSLEDLPESVLSAISLYLSKTTRALLAVALTAHSSSWEKFGWKISPSKASKVVLANPYFGTREESDGYHCTSKYFRFQPPRKYNENWDYLDFIDVEEHVRKSLTDVDIGALLTCIDGINRLKKLRLPELVKIHGHGLSPLRGSTVLQFLDASLSCGTKRPSKPLLSEESVVSILSSIANPLGSSLRGLHLPHCWGKAMKNGFGRSKFLGPFLQIYGYNSRPCFPGSLKSGCTKCERDLTLSLGFRDRLNISFDSDNTGFRRCPSCPTDYCNSCAGSFYVGISAESCSVCNKIRCEECSHIYECQGCQRHLCEDCRESIHCEGDECDGIFDSANCTDCAEREDANTKTCTRCNHSYCVDCKAWEYSPTEGNYCTECHNE
mmetsp:Transcript_9226/g.20815  ORF Transcript_9226/g.20815 Transcript_9226/m.20815 type:complete len:463 (-) Transcript_9226:687-2075(-)